jgi:hypothetical protein
MANAQVPTGSAPDEPIVDFGELIRKPVILNSSISPLLGYMRRELYLPSRPGGQLNNARQICRILSEEWIHIFI